MRVCGSLSLLFVRVAALPWLHRDPFDRLLVAQAMEERLTLLRVDVALKGYGRFVRIV
jgi:PIN domain nuclease of toxin-antitoxin system